MSETSPSYWNDTREGLRTVELRAAGFDPADTARRNAIVTVASAYTNAHRCNNRVRRIADLLVELIGQRGGQGLLVGTPAVSDALTQGTANAGYSLVSRDLMADCIEIGHYAHHGAGDDRHLRLRQDRRRGAHAAGANQRLRSGGLSGDQLAGARRLRALGRQGQQPHDAGLRSRARPPTSAGRITDDELARLEQCVMPGSGTCGAMFTANTMSTIAEAMGMMLTKGASHPADYDAASDIHDDVKAQARASVDALYALMAAGLRPRDIMTERAFENAIVTAYADGRLDQHVPAPARHRPRGRRAD